jgi:hypothetical protein
LVESGRRGDTRPQALFSKRQATTWPCDLSHCRSSYNVSSMAILHYPKRDNASRLLAPKVGVPSQCDTLVYRAVLVRRRTDSSYGELDVKVWRHCRTVHHRPQSGRSTFRSLSSDLRHTVCSLGWRANSRSKTAQPRPRHFLSVRALQSVAGGKSIRCGNEIELPTLRPAHARPQPERTKRGRGCASARN